MSFTQKNPTRTDPRVVGLAVLLQPITAFGAGDNPGAGVDMVKRMQLPF